MALSNKEKQKQFRERQRAKGLKPKLVWENMSGFVEIPGDSSLATRVPRYKFSRKLNKIIENMREVPAEEMLAELLAIAKRLKARYDKIEAEAQKIIQEEAKEKAPSANA